LVICCFLLFVEMFSTVEEAIKHYDVQRSKKQKALTIPSQIRQVYHFKQFLDAQCVGSDPRGAGADGKKHYALNSLRDFRKILGELSRMEQSNEYQY
jgi:hypothetical protein